ncbi:MAG TPA: hypothetical protein VJ276_23710 [Thermoanaerobaculia bacterium]|nr:hypothetical protein [Thermoanaerobaculia bacterium]
MSAPLARRDPRDTSRLPERDYAALHFIGTWYEVAQYQLEDAVFSGKSPTITSRCIRRLHAAGAIVVERWNRIGLNLIRLTNTGRQALLDRGIDGSAIFVPEKAVAPKDLRHQLHLVDIGLVLMQLPIPFDLAPCWTLRRRLALTKPSAIPDLLALRQDGRGGVDGAIAIEVDLGGERLKNVFVPKLALLRDTLAGWSGGAPAAIVVFTVGTRRIAALSAAIAAQTHAIPVVVFPLPVDAGRPGLGALRSLLEQVV